MKKIKKTSFLERVAKIEKLPKTASESIPFKSVMPKGVIETSPGSFTKTYKLPDINFTAASLDDQQSMTLAYQELLGTFDRGVRFQFNIYKHRTNKRSTLQNIQLPPAHDSKNSYRTEINRINLEKLQSGSASLTEDKYLTISMSDVSAEHAIAELNKQERLILQQVREVTKKDAEPLGSEDRVKLLYNIYNPDDFATNEIFENMEEFDFEAIKKSGLSVKDVVAQSGMDFSGSNYFRLGDTYATALFLAKKPVELTTSFISDIADVQCEMLISITSEMLDIDKSIKLVKAKKYSVNTAIGKQQLQNAERGIYIEPSQNLKSINDTAEQLLEGLSNDKSLYLSCFNVILFAPTKEALDENVAIIKTLALARHGCRVRPIRYQQEFAFNTALPLARNDLYTEIMFQKDELSILMPFNAQDIMQKSGVVYGTNLMTGGLFQFDRRTMKNFNGLVFGIPGSGKSMISKWEMIQSHLKYLDDQIFIIDPQGEFGKIVKEFNGQVIDVSLGTEDFINPLDIDLSESRTTGEDVIFNKIDFMVLFFNIIPERQGEHVTAQERIAIETALKNIYRSYIDTLTINHKDYDYSLCPTLADLYQEFLKLERDYPAAKGLSEALYPYAVGSSNIFAHRTNIKADARIVSYDISSLKSSMGTVALFLCINDMNTRLFKNFTRDLYTRMYIDEFHIPLEDENTAKALKRLWKTARKFKGIPTGIMQNAADLTRNEDTKEILDLTKFFILMDSSPSDIAVFQEYLDLSDSQAEMISNPRRGHGLIYNGTLAIPFNAEIPPDTKVYQLMDTSNNSVLQRES